MSYVNNLYNYFVFISQIKPITIKESIINEDYMHDMQEELNKFKSKQFV